MSLAMAAGLMASCTKDLEEVKAYAPENVVAPVINALDVTDVVITADNQTETLTFSWEAADFGAPTAINYSIMAAYNEVELPVVTGVNATEYPVTYEALNAVVAFDLKCPLDVASAVDFRIAASISSNYPTVYSDVITLNVTPTAAEKKYEMIYMPGSYQGWSPEGAATNFQVLYNFSGDDNVFEGIADFGEVGKAAEGWKFTTKPDWSFDYGIPSDVDQTTILEAAEVALFNNDDGDRSDIKIYGANRYYHFTLDLGSKMLKKNYSFDTVGVVGTINNWGGTPDVEMTFNAQKRRFYADIDVAADGEIKFRADNTWGANEWGGADGVATKGGANIKVAAGQYRVYLYISDPANMTYEFNTAMYGVEGDGNTEQPVGPEQPVVEKGGKFIYVNNQDGWAATYLYTWNAAEGGESSGQTNAWPGKEMTITTTVNGVTYVGYEMPESTNGMSINYIFNNNDGTQTADPATPIVLDRNYYFTIKDGVATEVQVEEVSYKLYADVTATGWENVNIWAWDADGNNYSGGNWPGVALSAEEVNGVTYYVFELPANVTGKTISVIFNNGTEQTVDLTGVVMDKDHTFTLTEKDASGKWLATIDGTEAPKPEEKVVVLGEHTWGLIGVNGDWGADVAMTLEQGWMVAKGVTFDAADSEFKVRADGGWDISYGTGKEYATVGGEAFTVTFNADNILLAEAGTYDIYFTIVDNAASMKVVAAGGGTTPEPEQPAALKLYAHSEDGWSSMNLYAWDSASTISAAWPGTPITETETVNGVEYFVYTFGEEMRDKTINIIFNNGSSQTQDITGVVIDGPHYYAVKGGNGTEVDPNTYAPSTPAPSAGPLNVQLGVVGDHTSWSSDSMMEWNGSMYVATGVALEAGKGFKVRKAGAWDDNFNFGPSAKSEIAVNGSLVVVNGSGAQDILVPATGTYDVYFDYTNMTVWMMEAGKTPNN